MCPHPSHNPVYVRSLDPSVVPLLSHYTDTHIYVFPSALTLSIIIINRIEKSTPPLRSAPPQRDLTLLSLLVLLFHFVVHPPTGLPKSTLCLWRWTFHMKSTSVKLMYLSVHDNRDSSCGFHPPSPPLLAHASTQVHRTSWTLVMGPCVSFG
jgi:hypothetical protein